MDDVAVRVAQHLDLDVARLLDVFLDKHAVVAKARFRLALRSAEFVAHGTVIGGDAHAFAATAGRRLDHDRIADVARRPDRALGVGHDIEPAGNGRDTGGARQLFRCDLVAHRGDRGSGRADKGHPGRGQRLGKGRVFGQKPVARMHRLGAALAAGCDDPVDPEIALGRRRRADHDRLVSLAHMQRLGIGFGIDRDRHNPHPPRGADHAAGDLAAIGDQDFTKHRNRTAWPG